MMRRLLLAGFILMCAIGWGEAMALEVDELVLTTAVVDREPVDAVEVFPVESGVLYCFTRLSGAVEPTTVQHLWYFGDELVSRVELPVGALHWRTWSAKRFVEERRGQWRVEIRDSAGALLNQAGFQVR